MAGITKKQGYLIFIEVPLFRKGASITGEAF